jgi:hypothetical protein
MRAKRKFACIDTQASQTEDHEQSDELVDSSDEFVDDVSHYTLQFRLRKIFAPENFLSRACAIQFMSYAEETARPRPLIVLMAINRC